MPSVTLHLSLEGSEPVSTRTVILSSQITLSDLHEVICNAFEFSGQQDHSFLPTHPQARTGFTLAEEARTVLPNLLVDPYGSAEYHYGSEESWIITISSLGFPTERMLVPKLIDATGPDIVEGCGGAGVMAQMREAARRAISALEVDPVAADHISDHLPGLHPHQVLARLTYIDPATIASRVCFAMLPGYVDGLGPVGAIHGDGTATDALANPADWPDAVLGAEPGEADPDALREQLPDGGGEGTLLGAETIREIQDALQGIPEDSIPMISATDAVTITASVRWYLELIGSGVTLTQAGYLPPALVRQVAARLELAKHSPGSFNRESQTITALILREVLEHLGLLVQRGSRLSLSALGEKYLHQPLQLAEHLARNLPLLHDPAEYEPMKQVFADLYQDLPPQRPYPDCYGDNRQFLLAMNVLTPDLDNRKLTPAGRAFLGLVLKIKRG